MAIYHVLFCKLYYFLQSGDFMLVISVLQMLDAVH